ncbi:MAG: PLP-dependent aminotransferase family protein, partial [Myxococcota bacterium]
RSALQAFDLRRPDYHPVSRTAEGLDLAALERAFEAGAKVFYLVATGHNPTGGVLADDERRAVLDLAARHDAWILDDDAYGEVCFGERPAPLRSFGRHLDRVVHLGSFSKVLAPGLRVGWLAGAPALVKEAVRVKSAEDLETATLTQRVLARWLDAHDLDAHVSRCITVYRERRDVLLDALRAALPSLPVATPEGGFSLLLRVPGADARALLPRAMAAGVAFEPALPYFVGGGEPGAIRVSFSNVAPDDLREAVRRLAKVVRDT